MNERNPKLDGSARWTRSSRVSIYNAYIDYVAIDIRSRGLADPICTLSSRITEAEMSCGMIHEKLQRIAVSIERRYTSTSEVTIELTISSSKEI